MRRTAHKQASEARRPGTELEADSREGEEVGVWKQTLPRWPRNPSATLGGPTWPSRYIFSGLP